MKCMKERLMVGFKLCIISSLPYEASIKICVLMFCILSRLNLVKLHGFIGYVKSVLSVK